MPTIVRVHLVLVGLFSLSLSRLDFAPTFWLSSHFVRFIAANTKICVLAGDKDERKTEDKRKGDNISVVRGPEFSQSFRASRFARVAAHDA
ncbi:hypothetical protein LX32DRAFT_646278 [Colletotrichum zoysiae]|uniref:Secreted protein n=1 Tax=Colletotrichum zoysiae TaxID=1216348 RepID=A0AAD9H3B0_9PEZI|nr:hypothetical protein LX32DRAFT_646278 [Colletotrichum zoysiae]